MILTAVFVLKNMRFDIITIFPEIFSSYFSESIIKRARERGLVKINIHNLRDFTTDKHRTVDDVAYGGGPGMVMRVEPIFNALKKIKSAGPRGKKTKVILLSAKGKKFDQAMARRLSKQNRVILICGRYEGVDERVAKYLADEEVSIGDYVLTGGELPAMIIVDATARLLPGVLGKKESLKEESFNQPDYLEYPQYTRPEKFKNWKVPSVLLSGDHKKIDQWRKKHSQLRTKGKRRK